MFSEEILLELPSSPGPSVVRTAPWRKGGAVQVVVEVKVSGQRERSMDWFEGNLQETSDFPLKYGVSYNFSL